MTMTNIHSHPVGETLNVFILMAAWPWWNHPELHPQIDLNKHSLWLPYQLYYIVISLAESVKPPVFKSIDKVDNISREELDTYLEVYISVILSLFSSFGSHQLI